MFVSLRLLDNAESACFEFSTRSMRRKHGGNHLTGHAHLARPNLVGPRRDFRRNFVSSLMKVLRHLMSTIQAVLPPRLSSRFLQQQQIQTLKEKKSYLTDITLNNNSEQELQWQTKKFAGFQWDFFSQRGSTICVFQRNASLTG